MAYANNRNTIALLFIGCVFLTVIPGKAESNPDFAALQAQAKETFSEGNEVDLFIRKYCAKCHGNKKAKAGLNYQRSLKNPGKVTNRKHWKLAITFVQSARRVTRVIC